MKKTGLIGLGSISKHIFYGIQFSKMLKLVSCADVDEKTKEKANENNCSFFTDYIEMIKQEKLEYVIIATPPSTHYDIIKNCLNAGVNVLVEKPAVLDLNQWDEVVALAKQKNLHFEVIYHWQNGEEIKKIKNFDLSVVKNIKISSNDPYSQDGKTALPDRVALGGSWIDSGINILSVLQIYLPLNTYKILKVENVFCEQTNIPIASKVDLLIDSVNVEIEIDWRNNLNQKITELGFDDEKIILHHSHQSIIRNGEEEVYSTEVRMNKHYKNYFSRDNHNVDLIGGRKIHEILLKVRDCYEKI